ncbi:MAG: FecR domain-containing protein [Cyclobacteriaceae bacterium]
MSDNNHSEETLLIAKHLSGETTSAEEEALQKWIALSSANEKIFLKFKRIYEVSGKIYDRSGGDALDIDVEKEWNHFVKEAEQKGKTIEFNPQTKSGMWLRIAAALLLVIASGVVINYFVGKGREHIYQTAENTEIISLPDGSTVSLNRNSILTVKNSFDDKNREVELLGEAFFEVVPDSQRPFTIQVGEAQVTVLGTSFNVQNLDSRNEVEVIVETGIVKLGSNEINQSVELKAGEKGVFRKNEKEIISNQNTDVNFLSWKTKTVIFNNTDLKSVVETLESTYGVEITISAEVSADCEITVTFENQSLESVLKVLKSTLDLTYRREGNKIEITGVGC